MKKYVIIGGVLVLLGFSTVAAVKVMNRGKSNNSLTSPDTSTTVPGSSALPAGDYDKAASAQMTNNSCSGVGSVPIIPPMKLDQVSSILPYGLMVGGHVTPIDHQYYNGLDIHAVRDTYEVVAPADARVADIEHRGSKYNTPLHSVDVPSSDEYRLVFVHSCSFLTYVDLVTSLSDSFKAKLGSDWTPMNPEPRGDVEVKQGEVIGYIGGQTLDFAVWDLSQNPLAGLLVRKAYDNAEGWKVFTAPTTKYLKADIKDATIAKYVRKTEPIDGKIDYDQEGKLIGTWFQEGTDGYYGSRATNPSKPDYWGGHLSFAPNFVDPGAYMVSLGSYNGSSLDKGNPDPGAAGASGAIQFGIKGNAPDPATVDASSGLVKYELVSQEVDKPDGQRWQNELVSPLKAVNGSTVQGTMLVQILAAHKLKVEVFPGKTAAQVSTFDDKAIMYNRGDDATMPPSTAY